MLRRFLKEVTRVKDEIFISGGVSSRGRGGILMPDGSPVPLEVIMVQFGVDENVAREIAARRSP